MDATLEVFLRGRVIFSSRGHWLYPLFELESFFENKSYDLSRVTVRDRVVGRGAAFLLTRLGIGALRAGVLSRRALDILDRAGTSYTWITLVEKISCRTEEELIRIDNPRVAYRILRERGARREGPASLSPAQW
jgi:hypothetical protein